MTLSSNMMAFFMMFAIAMVIVLPLNVLAIWLVPTAKSLLVTSSIPTVLYATKILLDWNTREL